jgi:Leucine Rich repeat
LSFVPLFCVSVFLEITAPLQNANKRNTAHIPTDGVKVEEVCVRVDTKKGAAHIYYVCERGRERERERSHREIGENQHSFHSTFHPPLHPKATRKSIMTSLVERIEASDEQLTDLRLTEAPQAYAATVEQLITAFQANTVIEYIRFDRDFLPGIMDLSEDDPDQVLRLFEAIGSIPTLKEALIWHASISVQALTAFLHKARHLQHLQLGFLDLQGTADDFANIAASLQNHPKLKSFDMVDFSLNDDSISIDDIVTTLATLPSLERVKLEVSYQKRGSLVGHEAAKRKVKVQVSGTALAALCRSQSVLDVHLCRLKLEADDFAQLATAIEASPALKAIALPHCNVNDEACSALALAIANSQTLESVDLSCNDITDEGCIAMATALKAPGCSNSTIKFLRLWGNVKISNHGYDAMDDLLEHNCTLERAPLMAPTNYKNRIDAKNVANRKMTNQAA